jgi:hypothetical protein
MRTLADTPGCRGGALTASAVVAVVMFAGCMETRRALGEDCLKNDDCLSGTCSQLHCGAAPTITDAQAVGDASEEPTVEATSDGSGASADSSRESGGEAAVDGD